MPKITALTETTAIDGTELAYVVEDPSGTPASRKVTIANLLGSVLTALKTAFTPASASGAASLALAEDTDNGTNTVKIQAPAAVASDKTATLQDVTGTLYVSGGTDVAVADGGTGASTAAGARSNLGVKYIVGGSNDTALSGDRYIGLFSAVATAGESVAASYFPAAGSLESVVASVSVAPTAGTSWAVTVYKNGTATAMTGTIGEAATRVVLSGGPIAFTATDTFSLFFDVTGAAPSAILRWSGEYLVT